MRSISRRRKAQPALAAALLAAVGALSSGADAQTADLTLHDDANYTYSATYANALPNRGESGPRYLYSLTVTGVSGSHSEGWLIWQPRWGVLTILVLQNDLMWGWALVGHWEGSGSPMWLAAHGVLGQERLWEGPAAKSASGKEEQASSR
jgi:hypothetical protein